MNLTHINTSRKLEKIKPFALTAMLAALAILPGAALAQTTPSPAIGTAFREAIPNIPGKSITGIVVDYAPGGKSPSHRHARSAFIVAYVLSGAIRSQVNDGPAQVFRAFSPLPRRREYLARRYPGLAA